MFAARFPVDVVFPLGVQVVGIDEADQTVVNVHVGRRVQITAACEVEYQLVRLAVEPGACAAGCRHSSSASSPAGAIGMVDPTAFPILPSGKIVSATAVPPAVSPIAHGNLLLVGVVLRIRQLPIANEFFKSLQRRRYFLGVVRLAVGCRSTGQERCSQ